MEKLKSFLKSRVQLANDELEFVLSHFRQHMISKDRFLVRRGQVVADYYFVVSGGLRIYLGKDGREVTGWIAMENDFFTELSSLKQQTPCRFDIVAIEDTML